jgi:hypothetical protein
MRVADYFERGRKRKMKRFMKSFFVALVIGALASLGVMAGDKGKVEKKAVTFPDDVMVNGTLVKAGEYEVKFDEGTGELSIIKNGEVKAKTPAHVEQRSDKARSTALRTVDKGGNTELLGVTFGGSNRDVIVGASGSTNGTQ